eukprot:362094-Chlamydomonas_euryale.AAC.11
MGGLTHTGTDYNPKAFAKVSFGDMAPQAEALDQVGKPGHMAPQAEALDQVGKPGHVAHYKKTRRRVPLQPAVVRSSSCRACHRRN